MDRVIKFRGKCSKKSKYKGEWVEGGLVVPRNIKDNEVLIISAHDVDCKFTYHVDKDTVGQFTGLYDKSGKEAYFDDIVKFKHKFISDISPSFNEEIEFLAVIDYDDFYRPVLSLLTNQEGFSKGYYFSITSLIEGEIIGNIHDNPELLKD